MARIVDCNWAGLDPSVMGLGPVLSMVPMIRRNGLSRSDIGAELNATGVRRPGARLPARAR
jgi:acetyl-CoA C-acetyltransferase